VKALRLVLWIVALPLALAWHFATGAGFQKESL
jgi:hypothetical protein